jgi:hypothetical protein
VPFLRPVDYFTKRFHEKQELAWLMYKAGLDLLLPMGRRSGKSELDAEIQIEDAEETGCPQLFTAITQKQARSIIWPKLTRRLLHETGWRANEQRLEWIYKGGPFIAVKGADMRADDLAGGAYRTIVCDEYALWKKPDIKQKILAPMLADFNGQFIISSTKRGKNHFWTLHNEAKANPEKYGVVEATMFDNPYISPEGRLKVISEYPGGEKNPLCQQEVFNQYVTFEGQIFALPEESYTEPLWQPYEYDHAFHWRGFDHGFSPDPTAGVWIAFNRRRGYFQVYCEYKQSRLLIKDHADAIRSLVPGRRYVETFSDVDPQVVAEYEDVGLLMTTAEKADKKARLLKLVNALRIGRVKIASNCSMLLQEMASLTWEDIEKETGEDHLVDSFDYGFNNLSIPAAETPEEYFASIDFERRELGPRRMDFHSDNHNRNRQDFGD